MDEFESANRTLIAPGVALGAKALRFSFSHSGGPGGQNVNKVATRVTLSVDLAELGKLLPVWAMRRLLSKAARDAGGEHLVIHSSATRSQQANRKDAVAKLRQMVIQSLSRPRYRKPTRPTAGSVQRRLERKKQRGQLKRSRQDHSNDE